MSSSSDSSSDSSFRKIVLDSINSNRQKEEDIQKEKIEKLKTARLKKIHDDIDTLKERIKEIDKKLVEEFFSPFPLSLLYKPYGPFNYRVGSYPPITSIDSSTHLYFSQLRFFRNIASTNIAYIINNGSIFFMVKSSDGSWVEQSFSDLSSGLKNNTFLVSVDFGKMKEKKENMWDIISSSIPRFFDLDSFKQSSLFSSS